MDTPPLDPDLYLRLLAISDEAFAAELYEVAYHALLAALHWADTAHDVVRLQEVRARAQEQRDWVAVQAPEHRHAPQAAARRGHRSIYDSLTLQADAMLARVRSAPAGSNPPP